VGEPLTNRACSVDSDCLVADYVHPFFVVELFRRHADARLGAVYGNCRFFLWTYSRDTLLVHNIVAADKTVQEKSLAWRRIGGLRVPLSINRGSGTDR
jgi:hypothetical protein